jgi:hypothetical protein
MRAKVDWDLIKVYINGFEWYLDIYTSPNRVYPENNNKSHEGFSVYSNHFTPDERRQIQEHIKYKLYEKGQYDIQTD